MKTKSLVAIMLAAVALLIFASVAFAVSQDTIVAIIDDAEDGRIDGDWTAEEIRAALDYVRNNPIYQAVRRHRGQSSKTTSRACRLRVKRKASSRSPVARSSCSSGLGPASSAAARHCVAVARRHTAENQRRHGAPARAPRFVAPSVGPGDDHERRPVPRGRPRASPQSSPGLRRASAPPFEPRADGRSPAPAAQPIRPGRRRSPSRRPRAAASARPHSLPPRRPWSPGGPHS